MDKNGEEDASAAASSVESAEGISSLSASDTLSSGGGLSVERPAVVEEVMDDTVLSDFNYFNSSDMFPLVGLVIASVSREPFERTEALPNVR